MSNYKERDPETDLFPLQAKAVSLLLEKPRLEDVARELEISRTTLWAWLNDNRFKLQLAEREAQELSAASRRLVSLCVKATEVLEKAMDDDPEDMPSPRAVRAADITLKRMPDVVQAAMLHVRVFELERMIMSDGD